MIAVITNLSVRQQTRRPYHFYHLSYHFNNMAHYFPLNFVIEDY